MPLPFFIGVAAAIAGVTGLGATARGAIKIKQAKDTMKDTDSRHKKNLGKFKHQNEITTKDMDKLGKKEMEILNNFAEFQDVFEKIKNRPEFAEVEINGVNIPEYNGEELKKVSIGAGVLLGGLGGAGLGAAGGFAAAGATTSAVMALGTASTGTAIASLSGAAATNATLAALGGGAVAAGGGGIALGTTILGAATAGVGLLVGGIIFNITGGSLSKKADEAYNQMKKAEAEINKICDYLIDLSKISKKYLDTLIKVEKVYDANFYLLKQIVEKNKKENWLDFDEKEKLITQNTVLLVSLLFNMCKVKIVQQSKNSSSVNSINKTEINHQIADAEKVLSEL